MEYQETGERCHVEHMADVDVCDHMERYQFAAQYVRGCSVLDIACGTGYGSDLLRKSGATSVTGVDVAEDAVAEARRLYPESHYVPGSMLDFDDGVTYDRIISFETIEHIDDYKAGLRNLRRLLKPGGKLLLSTPNRPVNSPQLSSLADKPNHRFHIREFNVAEMYKALLEAGFRNGAIYGQKQRWLLRPRPLALAYAAAAHVGIFRGHFKPQVLPLKAGLEPRYTVYVCQD